MTNNKRDILNLIPLSNRTEWMKKFFNVTINHLFQPEQVEKLNGYFGQIPDYTNINTDFYINEANQSRLFYSLEPTVVSSYNSNQFISFYEDFINYISFQGGLVNNQNRLFDSEYYTWCPPIDLDMLINYQQYYWVPNGANPYILLSLTDIENDFIGNENELVYYKGKYHLNENQIIIDGNISPLMLINGMRITITNDYNNNNNNKIFIIDGVGRKITLSEDVDISKEQKWDQPLIQINNFVVLYLDIDNLDDFINQIKGQIKYEYIGLYKLETDNDLYSINNARNATFINPIIFVDGMRVIFNYKGKNSVRLTKSFIIFDVGISIRLYADLSGWDDVAWGGSEFKKSIPDYIIMERGAIDKNPWSISNRWVNKSVLSLDYIISGQAQKAVRPIIQFNANLDLYNFKGFNKINVDVKEDKLSYSDIVNFIVIDPDYFSKFNNNTDSWRRLGIAAIMLDVGDKNSNFIDKTKSFKYIVKQSITKKIDASFTGLTENELNKCLIYIDNTPIYKGSYYIKNTNIIFYNYITRNNIIYIINWDNSRGVLIHDGQTILITNDKNENLNNKIYKVSGIKDKGKILLSLIYEIKQGDSVITSSGYKNVNKNFYFDGIKWENTQIKNTINQPILFNLYDIDGHLLNDPDYYTESNFKGNKIFGFDINTQFGAIVDPILYLALNYDNTGQIMFNNYLNTKYQTLNNDIPGYYFYATKSNNNIILSNNWYKSPVITKQYINVTVFAQLNQTSFQCPYNITYNNKKEVSYLIDINIPLFGDIPLILENILISNGTRLLLINQNDKKYNGIYTVIINSNNYNLIPDDNIFLNLAIYINLGKYKNTIWSVDNSSEIDNIIFTQLNGPYPYPSPIIVSVNGNIKKLCIDYTIDNGVCNFITQINKDDLIIIRMYNKNSPDFNIGNYEIPINLESNPLLNDVNTFSRNQIITQFNHIINNQNVDYNNSKKDPSFGNNIIQSKYSLVKSMLLSSNENVDFISSINYCSREFNRFRNKLIVKMIDLFENKYTGNVDIPTLIDDSLDEINLGKTVDFPFAYSTMAPGSRQYIDIVQTINLNQSLNNYVIDNISSDILAECLFYIENSSLTFLIKNYDYILNDDEIIFTNTPNNGDKLIIIHYLKYFTFVPPSLSYLGISNIYKPEYYDDVNLLIPNRFILCHDGSRLPIIEHEDYNIINDAILQFEIRCYNNIKAKFNNRNIKSLLDYKEFVSGKYRKNVDYTWDEFINMLRPNFEKWVAYNNYNYRQNTTFNPTNPFSFNYSKCIDRYGEEIVAGHWRGIYIYYFDTDRPHTHPWEMLGFSQKPSWWDDEYGVSPYTRGNIHLWKDIERGYIAHGEYKGINEIYARPGFMDVIPIDDIGNLLDPISAQIIIDLPNSNDLQSNWFYGDFGPTEIAWRFSPEYQYSLSIVLYLMKPIKYIDSFWDTLNNKFINGSLYNSEQWVNADTNNRKKYQNIIVHGEEINGSIYKGYGIQQIISDFLISNGQLPKTLGDMIRSVNVNLGHKMGGYINKDSLIISSDNFGVVPTENIHILLHKSSIINEYVYSGVSIQWTGYSYKIIGYDVINPVFNTIPGDPNGSKTQITVGVNKTPIKINKWLSNTNYMVGAFIENNNNTYQCISSHQSSMTFDSSYWQPATIDNDNDGKTVIYYLESNKDNLIRRVPYGTEMNTEQEVFNFLIDYSRYLSYQGWTFDDNTGQNINTWLNSAQDFIFWTLTNWYPGTTINISPSASLINFIKNHGEIQAITKITKGVYNLLDSNGEIIDIKNVNISRVDNQTTIKSTIPIYLCRLYVAENEHILTFDNKTIFNDVIYDQLYDVRQVRFKINCIRTINWNGRFYAPGYLIDNNNNNLIPNFEKSKEDSQKYYDIYNSVDINNFKTYARHLIGYQDRTYLTKLFTSSDVQFEFYQGMVKEKGTRQNLNALLRTFDEENNGDVKFMDEWMFRLGQYGATYNNAYLEFLILDIDYKEDPIYVMMYTNDNIAGTTINLTKNDNRWKVKPDLNGKYIFKPLISNINNINIWRPNTKYIINDVVQINDFKWVCIKNHISSLSISENINDFNKAFYQDLYKKRWKIDNKIEGSLPTAGAVRIDEVQVIAKNLDDLNIVYNDFINNNNNIYQYDKIWLYDTGFGDWNVFRVSSPDNFVFLLKTEFLKSDMTKTVLTFTNNHGYTIGDENYYNQLTFSQKTIYLSGNSLSKIKGFFTISSVQTTNQIIIKYSNSNINISGNDVQLLILSDLRYYTLYDVPATIPGGWKKGDIILVDNAGTLENPMPGCSAAYKMICDVSDYGWDIPSWEIDAFDFGFMLPIDQNPCWVIDRSSCSEFLYPKSDSSLLKSALIYDKNRNRVKTELVLFDPAKGFIPGVADKEIYYKIEIDPAYYNGELSWGDEQLGRLWWNLNEVKFLDYEISDELYRRTHWGKIAPRMAVNIYEWTKSTLSPNQWDKIYPNTLKNVFTFVQKIEYNNITNDTKTVYYFWIKNPTAIPDYSFRSISAYDVANIINNPTLSGISWFAPVTPNSILISGVLDAITYQDSVFQLNYQRNPSENNIHTQFILLRENDIQSVIPDILWNKMKDSIIGFDNLNQLVPDTTISDILQIGILYRPRQSMFVPDYDNNNQIASRLARKVFIQKINTILSSNTITTRNISGLNATDENLLIKTEKSVDSIIISKKYKTNSIYNVKYATTFELSFFNNLTNLTIDGHNLNISDIILVKNQHNIFENGIYVFVKNQNEKYLKKLYDNQNGDVVNVTNGNNNINKSFIVENNNWIEQINPYEYHYETFNFNERNDLSTKILIGSLVLVRGNINSGYFWSIWRYDGESIFTLIQSQKYKCSDFWSYVNFYATGYSSLNAPRYVFKSENLRDKSGILFVENDLIEIRNDNGWYWLVIKNGIWYLAAKQNASIQLSDKFYKNTSMLMDYTTDYNIIYNRDGSLELKYIIDAIRNNILTDLEQNQLFFTMVNHAHSKQNVVDWAIKSSLLTVRGFRKPLWKSPYQAQDLTQSLYDFITETKPYHTKIKEFIFGYNISEIENGKFFVSDFDKPIGIDSFGNAIIYPVNANDTLSDSNLQNPILQTIYSRNDIIDQNLLSSSWYNNWKNNITTRKMNTRILFDRIKIIDWLTINSIDFEKLYDNQFGINTTWGTNRAVVPGHRVLAKNLEQDETWRVYQLTKSKSNITNISVNAGYLYTNSPTFILNLSSFDINLNYTSSDFNIMTECPYIIVPLIIPEIVLISNGNDMYTNIHYVRKNNNDVRVFTLDSNPIEIGAHFDQLGNLILDTIIPKNKVFIVTSQTFKYFYATLKIVDIINSSTIVVNRPQTLREFIFEFNKPIFFYISDRTTYNEEEIYIDQNAPVDALTQAERLHLYYNPLPGMPQNNNRDLLNGNFKGTLVDGGFIEPGNIHGNDGYNTCCYKEYVYNGNNYFPIPRFLKSNGDLDIWDSRIVGWDCSPWSEGEELSVWDKSKIIVKVNGENINSNNWTFTWNDTGNDPLFAYTMSINPLNIGDIITIEIDDDSLENANQGYGIDIASDSVILGGSLNTIMKDHDIIIDGGMYLRGSTEIFNSNGEQIYILSNYPYIGVIPNVTFDDNRVPNIPYNPGFNQYAKVFINGKYQGANRYQLRYENNSWNITFNNTYIPNVGDEVMIILAGPSALSNPYYDENRPEELAATFVNSSMNMKIYCTGSKNIGFRLNQTMNGTWEYTRMSDEHSTKLISPLTMNSTYIEVEDVSKLIPTSGNGVLWYDNPEIIYINDERIEYHKVDVSANRIYRFRRGTGGTSGGIKCEYLRYPIIVSNDSNTFTLFNWGKYNNIAIYKILIDNNGIKYWDHEFKDYEFTIMALDNDLIVNFIYTIPVGVELLFQTLNSDWKTNNINYPIGTIVKDAGTKQKIPEGYYPIIENQKIRNILDTNTSMSQFIKETNATYGG